MTFVHGLNEFIFFAFEQARQTDGGIFHGTIDEIVPVSQADALAIKLREKGLVYRYDRAEGWPHGLLSAEVMHRRSLNLIFEFLHDHLPLSK